MGITVKEAEVRDVTPPRTEFAAYADRDEDQRGLRWDYPEINQ